MEFTSGMFEGPGREIPGRLGSRTGSRSLLYLSAPRWSRQAFSTLDSSVVRAMEINLEPLYARYPSGGAVEPSPSERCTITESVQCPNL
jgi:hypothetical protein